MMKRCSKNKSPHFFAPPRSLRSGGAKKWGLLFFFKKYKNRNNDFTTILDSENVNGMMPSTKFCSNLTDGVPGGSVVHTGSPWTLKITSILLTSGGDPILGSKIRFITILAVFTGTSYREVLYLGLEFIGLWLICTKYVNFLMSHTQHMYPSCPTIRWPLLSRLSVIPSNMTFRLFPTSNSI